MEKLVTRILPNEKLCSQKPNGNEDWEMGKCLAHSAIFTDERDDKQQKRFFPTGINDHLKQAKNLEYWYDRSQYYDVPQGNLTCCSDIPIAFHYVRPQEMYLIEYFVTKVHPFGIGRTRAEKLPPKFSLNEIMRAADVESLSKNYRKHSIFHNIDNSETIRRRRSY